MSLLDFLPHGVRSVSLERVTGPNGSPGWQAVLNELPYFRGLGKTPEEAVRNAMWNISHSASQRIDAL